MALINTLHSPTLQEAFGGTCTLVANKNPVLVFIWHYLTRSTRFQLQKNHTYNKNDG
jgi:hypothetical protein